MRPQRSALTGAPGGICRPVAAISDCSSGLPGSMSSRLTGMPSDRRAAHSSCSVIRPDCAVDGERAHAERAEQLVELLLLGRARRRRARRRAAGGVGTGAVAGGGGTVSGTRGAPVRSSMRVARADVELGAGVDRVRVRQAVLERQRCRPSRPGCSMRGDDRPERVAGCDDDDARRVRLAGHGRRRARSWSSSRAPSSAATVVVVVVVVVVVDVVVDASVVAGSVVAGCVVAGSVVAGSVVAGSWSPVRSSWRPPTGRCRTPGRSDRPSPDPPRRALTGASVRVAVGGHRHAAPHPSHPEVPSWP